MATTSGIKEPTWEREYDPTKDYIVFRLRIPRVWMMNERHPKRKIVLMLYKLMWQVLQEHHL